MNDAIENWQEQHTDANGITRTFLVETFYDDTIGAPWNEEDMHGPVSEWTTRGKRAGEWVLCAGHGAKRYYDASKAQRTALRDGWGRKGATGTKREIAAEAVKRDYKYLKSWCDNEWCYVYVKVTPLTSKGDALDSLSYTLGSVESFDEDYIKDCAHDLMEEVSLNMGKSYRLEV